MKRIARLGLMIAFLFPASLMAANFPAPTDVRIEGSQLLWSAVPDAGGYNIYWQGGYLTTVRGRTGYELTLEGQYQVVAFDESASVFSEQRLPEVTVDYEDGGTLTETVSVPGSSPITVVAATCRNVAGGESCVASCSAVGRPASATGGACATSDIVEADAVGGVNTYSCTVPTFSGQVSAQVYCLDINFFARQ